MKNSKTILVMFAIAATFIFNACRKDDDSNNDIIPTITTVFSAKLDGVQFSDQLAGAMLDTESNELVIMGDNSAGMLDVTLDGDIAVGTFTVGSGASQGISWNPEGGFTYFDQSGTIIVTKHDVVNNRIEGTFTATLVSTMPPNIQLTDGVFKVNYSEL